MINQFVTDETSKTANNLVTKSSRKYISTPYIYQWHVPPNEQSNFKIQHNFGKSFDKHIKKNLFANLKTIESNKITVERYMIVVIFLNSILEKLAKYM